MVQREREHRRSDVFARVRGVGLGDRGRSWPCLGAGILLSSGLVMKGKAESVYLVELFIWLCGPQMSVPRPDLSSHPSAHPPLDVSLATCL